MGHEGQVFLENVQNLMYISKMRREMEKKFFVSEIIVSELVALNCLYSEENTCHWESMC